jgi:hypothetical protein
MRMAEKWTRFMDMHSGGAQKEDAFAYLLIEAPQNEAEIIFYARFGHNPNRVTCTCCGEDYSIGESDTLAEATAYDRNCPWVEDVRGHIYPRKDRPDDYKEGFYLEPGEAVPDGMRIREHYGTCDEPTPLDGFLAAPDKHGYAIIRKDEIKPEERTGHVPEQGYVWVD